MAQIVVIDDAVNDSFLLNPVSNRYVLKNGVFHKGDARQDCKLSHGTLVAKVLEQYALDYNLINLQITDNWFQSKKCPIEFLRKALEFCLEIQCDVINISLGSKRLSDMAYLTPIIQEIRHREIPIVAACSNSFHRTVPAADCGVLGVICDRSNELKTGTYAIRYNPYLGTEYMAHYALDMPHINDSHESNSLATAVITAKINQIQNKKHLSYAALIQELDACATPIRDVVQSSVPNPVVHNEIPVVYCVDLFTNKQNQQKELLDLFNRDGYEVLGISDDPNVTDVRFISLVSVGHGPIREIQQYACDCAKTDLVIFFCSFDWLTQQDWRDYEEDSAVLVSYDDMMCSTIPFHFIKKKYTVSETCNVQTLCHELHAILSGADMS